ncbi:hypothetical protein [Hydrogenophilus thiooxidans]|uniref:hypothetical protein n=1 Tax=Hydrogenophilus thiooxidans TaxID=2820326 RepID=UPI001C24D601|nr:hypothetical protein [Hydrogenophilus thiooxidans]
MMVRPPFADDDRPAWETPLRSTANTAALTLPEIPPVPLDALPVLTEKAELAASQTVQAPCVSPPPPETATATTAAKPLSPGVSDPVPNAPAVVTEAEDEAFARWVAERTAALVQEELTALTERVVARLEWELKQKRRERNRL